MKKCINVLFVLVFFCCNLISQEQQSIPNNKGRNAFFGEIGGNAFWGSLNYSRLSRNNGKFIRSAFRIGFGVNPELYPGKSFPLLFLMEESILLGKKGHYFEMGLGINAYNIYRENYGKYGKVLSVENFWYPYLTHRVGYRFQRENGGLFYSVCGTPFITESSIADAFQPWAGVSFGYCF